MVTVGHYEHSPAPWGPGQREGDHLQKAVQCPLLQPRQGGQLVPVTRKDPGVPHGVSGRAEGTRLSTALSVHLSSSLSAPGVSSQTDHLQVTPGICPGSPYVTSAQLNSFFRSPPTCKSSSQNGCLQTLPSVSSTDPRGGQDPGGQLVWLPLLSVTNTRRLVAHSDGRIVHHGRHSRA
jgi:hypothetical protein